MNEYIKKYRLSIDQIETYEWIKNQKLNTDDNTICYWVKTYERKRIVEVINFAKKRKEKGQDIRNVGGWIQKFLKTGQTVVNDECNDNLNSVKKFLEINNWEDLKIYEKYIKDMVTNDDLPLTMEREEFKRALESLYQKSRLYKA
jgi:GTP:adenosylcobinamide-phosphate guanylyltransferase